LQDNDVELSEVSQAHCGCKVDPICECTLPFFQGAWMAGSLDRAVLQDVHKMAKNGNISPESKGPVKLEPK